MDYAALVGAPPRSAVGDTDGPLYWVPIRDMSSYDNRLAAGSICSGRLLWGGSIDFVSPTTPQYTGVATREIFATQGVIVRSSFYSDGVVEHDLKLPGPTRFNKITDGASKTIVLCEKRIGAEFYNGLNPSGQARIDDDAGWSDGWDYDTLRLAYCQPTPDSVKITGPAAAGGDFMASGSAHTSVLNCAYADGSVHAINYDIDVETYNLFANKSDGEVIDTDF
jgi:hypothetical protein